MFQSLTFTIITLLFLKPRITLTQSCEDKYLYGPNHTVKIKLDGSLKRAQCKWIISPPEQTITVLSIFETRVNRCYQLHPCCLTLSGSEQRCNEQLKDPLTFSFKQYPINLVLDVSSQIELQFEYSTRPSNECSNTDFQCLDRSNCFNYVDRCSDHMICKDNSDKRGCGTCAYNSTWCGTNSDYCFELSQRCDGVLNCPKGEDELGCSTDCNGIQCPRDTKCINPHQICDDIIDCSTGFDESNCPYSVATKSFHIAVTFLICSVCSIVFICLICRWMNTRRDLNRVLQNLPDFPLPPFHGPGDHDDDTISSSEILDADIRPGGELYENYINIIKKRTVSAKSVQVGEAKYHKSELDGENELVVLASLGVPVNLCVGLKVSEDSIMSLTNSRASANSGGGDQPRSNTNMLRTGPSTKIIRRDDLELIDEKRALKSVKSAPIPSNHTPSRVKSALPASTLDLTKTIKLKAESKSDSLVHHGDVSSSSPRQIIVKPYTDQTSEGDQWTDMEDFHNDNDVRIVKNKYERRRKKLKRRHGLHYNIL